MAKYTYAALCRQRSTVMGKHYLDEPFGLIWTLGISESGNIYVYPTDDISYNDRITLARNQIQTFMHSTEFDRDLFEMLAQTIGIRADAAFIMSLS